MRPSSLEYRADIDGLRAIAVAAVVGYHGFPRVFRGGFSGVDVFFVISGFLITGLILKGLREQTFGLMRFYRHRINRIVPALLTVIAACVLVGWVTMLPGEWEWLGRSLTWCAPFMANLYFASTGSAYFDRATELAPLLHLWSLGVEEQFYIAWPLLLIAAIRYDIVIPVLVAIVITSLGINIWGGMHAPIPHFYLPSSRAWELAAGGLLAVRQRSLPLRTAGAFSVAGLLLIALAAILLGADRGGIASAWTVMPTLGALLLIGAGPNGTFNRSLLCSRPMVFLGRISYPLYLWHWPLFSFGRMYFGRIPPALIGGLIVIAVAAAFVTFRFIEIPVRFGELRHRAPPVLLACLLALAVLGRVIGSEWIPGRLSDPAVRAWDTASRDWVYPHVQPSDVDPVSGFSTETTASHVRRTVLFIGDSHIQQYWVRAKSVIDREPDTARTAAFATLAGCPPLPSIDTGRPRRRCAEFFEYAMTRARRPEVDTVVFGAFWEDYLLGEFGRGNSQPIYGAHDGSQTPLRLDSAGTRLAFEGLQRAITELVGSGRRVFVVLSNPTSPQFDPDTLFPVSVRLLVKPQRSLPLEAAGRSVDVEQFLTYVAPVNKILFEIAVNGGAKTLDPRSSLCVQFTCPATSTEAKPLYLDSNHLTAGFSRARASFLDVVLIGTAAP